ncbi:hypothetical protein [Urbifossiella limnaea]|uniref:Glycosyltransferase RgtA/B/C/D-like domain-containing protein n=1 Tax=Urbifossiella limnaea TaxID=2528023 RepID=A0A517Y1D3_9BACT|nr:hypothetical protein [Urbifossiella limnaea]QDU23587.1 hypothetical protein ETAA1_55900 [Urbifossiella limnaea]
MDAPRSPWWIPFGGLLLAALYLPTLATPFDFVDDGNLVYPTPGLSAGEHVGLWWEKVEANYEHLGPFRPTLWVHWQVQANLFDGSAVAWRAYRFVWCALSAAALLWLLAELGAHPAAALLAGALAMWNPYRNEIWTSLTLSEGVAMPYALFALVAARKAATSATPLRWELLSALAVLVALGCKNTFAALVPVQILLRMWPDGMTLREALKRNGARSLLLGVTLVLPAAHFVYFKAHWHPGQYETHGPTAAQLGRMLSALKGAVSLEFMAAGLLLAALALWKGGVLKAVSWQRLGTPPVLAALLLVAAGVVVYLPLSMMSGRYAMPAVWGLDVLFALLLTALIALPLTAWKKAAFAGVCTGLAVVAVAGVGKQEKFAARAHLLWDAVRHVEATAPPDARIAWMSGDSTAGGLNIEEGIHFRWHLLHRGRGDVAVGLFDESGKPLDRVELPPLAGPPEFALFGKVEPAGWEPERSFVSGYWLGRRQYDCRLARKRVVGTFAEAPFRDEVRRQLFPGLSP